MEVWGVAQHRSCLRGMLSLHAEMLVSPNATNEAAWSLYEYCSKSRLKLLDISRVAKPKLGVWLSPLDSSFHRFPGAQIFFYKRPLISNSRNSFYDGATAETANVVRALAI